MPERIIVISDSHIIPTRDLEQVAEHFATLNANRLIHLGDGSRDADCLQDFLDIPLTTVVGNCDLSRGSLLPAEVTLNIGGAKFLICHGHTHYVKNSLIRLKLRAEEVCANAALYGHTHIPNIEYAEGILLLNPGALRDKRYAVLDIERGEISPRLCHL